MKTLYLHCGYHKTGSSFLQMLFARNRQLLEKKNIFYPFSADEVDMLQGKISPGNGAELSDSLTSANQDMTADILQQDLMKALEKSCTALLYSSELLFHAFAKEKALLRLCDAAEKNGIEAIKALVYFRDPVSHALSTYKHRAKNGDYADFQYWISNSYETMELLSKFSEYHSEYPVTWTCRKYQSDSIFMAESAFEDWLEIQVPRIPDNDKVNSSLTLSEIRLIQVLKNNFSETIPFVREELIQINKEDKSDSDALNQVYQLIANQVLNRYRGLINSINEFLPIGEKLEINKAMSHSVEYTSDLEITFKEKQVERLIQALYKAKESRKIYKRAMGIWKKGFSRIKRNLRAAGY